MQMDRDNKFYKVYRKKTNYEHIYFLKISAWNSL